MLPDTMPTDLLEQMALVVAAVKDQETRLAAMEAAHADDDSNIEARVATLETDVAKLKEEVEPAAASDTRQTDGQTA
jgi:uncharacterized protein YceH (UPF0502 family)